MTAKHIGKSKDFLGLGGTFRQTHITIAHTSTLRSSNMACDFPIFYRGFPSQPCLITSPKNRAVDIGCGWTQNGPHFSPAKNQCVRRLMLFSQISADVWTWHNIHNTYGNSQISQRPPAIRPSKLQGESKFHNDRGCVQFLRWKSLAELRIGSMTNMNRVWDFSEAN